MIRMLLISLLVISSGVEVSAETILPLCFEKRSPETLRAVVKKGNGRFQVIPPGGLDNQTEWFTERIVGTGATIVSKGGQYQEYIELLEIDSKTVSLKRYGHARRLGQFDEVIKVDLLEKCITNGSS